MLDTIRPRLLLLFSFTFLVGCGPPEPTGADVYAEHCAECHGMDGRGDPQRRGFYRGIDLTRSELVLRGEQALVYRRITYGYGAMPGFRNKLQLQQLLDVTEHTLNFRPQGEEQ